MRKPELAAAIAEKADLTKAIAEGLEDEEGESTLQNVLARGPHT